MKTLKGLNLNLYIPPRLTCRDWRKGGGAVGMGVVVQSFGPSTQAHTGRETVEFEASLFRAFQTRLGNVAGGGGGRKKDTLCI